MRSNDWLFGFFAVGFVNVAGACAEAQSETYRTSDDDPTPDAASVSEAGTPPVTSDGGEDVDAAPSLLCSTDGWCAPEVPEPPPTNFFDLWPLPTTVFAVSESGVLELDGDRWVYVNDRVAYGRAIWASSPDNLWAAGLHGAVLHGTRSSGTWQWTEENIGEDVAIAAIWGSGTDDIYALTNKAVYHRESSVDGGPVWKIELEDDAVPDLYKSNSRTLTAITGSGRDDVWISGARGSYCGYLAHKSQGTYTVVADCNSECIQGMACKGIAAPPAWFDPTARRSPLRVHVATPQSAMGVRGESLVSFTRDGAGAYVVSRRPVSGVPPTLDSAVPSLWGPTATDLYLGGQAQVRHNPDVAEDGGTFTISSIALNGAPLRASFIVRGANANTIWAFGGPYAVRKK
ncbi:hypothetical protein AKJ09_01772 [Labilithrix luteola]|uniref:Type IV fimbrial biogenesis protein PilY1 n=2 Tax=Labilithrix luteola TaxID=1391654 RepID=A0A0K1PNK4_9BACT|nr:hypothetical protein AKJ09_01772 [Labilithrix luteola]